MSIANRVANILHSSQGNSSKEFNNGERRKKISIQSNLVSSLIKKFECGNVSNLDETVNAIKNRPVKNGLTRKPVERVNKIPFNSSVEKNPKIDFNLGKTNQYNSQDLEKHQLIDEEDVHFQLETKHYKVIDDNGDDVKPQDLQVAKTAREPCNSSVKTEEYEKLSFLNESPLITQDEDVLEPQDPQLSDETSSTTTPDESETSSSSSINDSESHSIADENTINECKKMEFKELFARFMDKIDMGLIEPDDFFTLYNLFENALK